MSRTVGEIYEFDEFRLDVSERRLSRRDKLVPLPEKAFDVLCLLLRNSGRLVGKEELLSTIWAGAFVEENNLDKNISLVRRALAEKRGERRFIETVRGHGYRFVAEARRIEPAQEEPSELNPQIVRPPEKPNFSALRREAGRDGNIIALPFSLCVAENESGEDGAKEKPKPLGSTLNDKAKTSAPREGNHIRRSITIAVLVFAVGASVIGFRNFLAGHNSNVRSADFAPFETFRIRRHADNGSFKRAVVSPDGRFIAYTDKNFAVWLKNVATDSNVKILPEAETGERTMIGFSPDGNYVYFHLVPQNRRSEILKMPVFGGATPQKIAEDAWSHPSLSPDGSRIAFTRYDSQNETFSLIAASADGTGERTVTTSRNNERFDSWIQATAWSPDASRIACIGRSQQDESIVRFIAVFRAADGSEVLRINPDATFGSLQAVAWLPDGDNLLVIGNDSSSLGQIYRYTILTETWRRVTNDLSDYLSLSVTADGETVLTTLWNNQSNLWVLSADSDANRDARQITFGHNTIDDAAGVSWTADGRIVYASNASGRWEIWMIDADGANQKQLTNNCVGNDSCTMPFVSPDNRHIVFQASRNGINNIWRIDIDGGNPRQLTTGGGILPFVAADSRSVIYVNKTLSTSTLWQVSMGGGDARRLSELSPIYVASLSPDGRRLAFFHYDRTARQPWQTCVMPVDADSPERCFGRSRSFPRWTADGNAFYYLAHDYRGIWKQPLEGERQLFLEFVGERVNNFAFSPDGTRVVIARSRPTQDIVALISER